MNGRAVISVHRDVFRRIDGFNDSQRGSLFRFLPSGSIDSRACRYPASHAVKPATDGLERPERFTAPHKHQECRLESVCDVGLVAKRVAADSQNHGPVPQDQNLEGCVRGRAAAIREPLEQLAVRHAGGCPEVEQRLNVAQEWQRTEYQPSIGHSRGSCLIAVSISMCRETVRTIPDLLAYPSITVRQRLGTDSQAD